MPAAPMTIATVGGSCSDIDGSLRVSSLNFGSFFTITTNPTGTFPTELGLLTELRELCAACHAPTQPSEK